jgi:hypothetical protein
MLARGGLLRAAFLGNCCTRLATSRVPSGGLRSGGSGNSKAVKIAAKGKHHGQLLGWRFFSSETLMNYRSGAYHVVLDMPNSQEHVTFSFIPSTPILQVQASLQEEGALSANVTSKDGSPLRENMTLSDLAETSGGFCVDLGAGLIPVSITHSMGYGDLEIEGRTALPSLLEKARIMELRAVLAEDTRRSIPYSTFEQLCGQCAIPNESIATVASDLHRVGVILHFSRDPNLKNVVYLRPEEIIEDLFRMRGLESPLQQHTKNKIAFMMEKLEAARADLAPLEALRRSLEERADARVTGLMWGVTGGVTAGALYYFYLVYVAVGWDVMEPVTYFTAAGISTLGYAWWMVTNHDHEHAGMRDYFHKLAIKHEYKRGGLSQEQLVSRRKVLRHLEKDFKALDRRSFQLSCMGVQPNSKSTN